jgi:hypothetical protein
MTIPLSAIHSPVTPAQLQALLAFAFAFELFMVDERLATTEVNPIMEFADRVLGIADFRKRGRSLKQFRERW